MAVKQYQEGSAITVNAKLKDERDTFATPQALQYRIDCETTGTAILPWTTIPAGQDVNIPVTSGQNALINAKNPYERKVLTIQSNPGTDSQIAGVVKWDIARNVAKYTNGQTVPGNDYGNIWYG